MPKCYVYIDGFNLYKRRLHELPHCKWLNIRKFVTSLLIPYLGEENLEIKKIKFFTATMSDTERDPGISSRQHVYLRALKSDNVEVIYGKFLKRPKRGILIDPQCVVEICSIRKEILTIEKFEEKKTDVNIAVNAMYDALTELTQKDFVAILTNDIDQAPTLRALQKLAKIKTVIISPVQTIANDLAGYADYKITFSDMILLQSQFEDVLSDNKGKFHKPHLWQ